MNDIDGVDGEPSYFKKSLKTELTTRMDAIDGSAEDSLKN
jgi:hypothetical protein